MKKKEKMKTNPYGLNNQM